MLINWWSRLNLEISLKRSQKIALISVFAALNVIFDSIALPPQLSSGVWYGLIFILEPLNGIILGPLFSFASTLIGVLIGHSILLRGDVALYEYLFTLGVPIGAMVSGLLYQKRWRLIFMYFAILLTAYFFTPVTSTLPVWGIWNTLLSFMILSVINILPDSIRSSLSKKKLFLPLIAFIGLEADILFRIFLFVPCQTYQILYGFTAEVLQAIWVAAAFITPIQVMISVLITTIVGPYVMRLSLLNQRQEFNINNS